MTSQSTAKEPWRTPFVGDVTSVFGFQSLGCSGGSLCELVELRYQQRRFAGDVHNDRALVGRVECVDENRAVVDEGTFETVALARGRLAVLAAKARGAPASTNGDVHWHDQVDGTTNEAARSWSECRLKD